MLHTYLIYMYTHALEGGARGRCEITCWTGRGSVDRRAALTRQGDLEKGRGGWERIGWGGMVDARVILSRGERKRMAKASESGIGRR